MNPIPACRWRDVRPQSAYFRSGGRESFFKIGWDAWLRFFRCGRDLQRNHVSCFCPRRFAESSIDFQPMAFLPVGLQHRLETNGIDRPFDCGHAA